MTKFGPHIDRMTAYCTFCPKMCRFSCPAASAEGRETVTPWGMMRLLELAKDGSVALDDDVADAFFHCTGCRRCQTFCAHDNDVPRALWKARSWVVDSGFLPEAYQEMYQRFEEHQSPWDEAAAQIDDSPFDRDASVAYWPDCSTAAHSPELVGAIGRLLEKVLGEPVRLVRSEEAGRTPCCGFPLSAAGIESPEEIRDKRWPGFEGVHTVWTDCAALAAWNHPSSSWQLDDDDTPQMGHIFELLARRLPEIEPPDNPLDAADCLLHQSCYVTRQIDAKDLVDSIVSQITDTPPDKLAYGDDESPCCGGRVHYQVLEPEASDLASQKVVESLERNEGKERMVTTSSMCHHAMDEASEQDVVESLLRWVCEAYEVIS